MTTLFDISRRNKNLQLSYHKVAEGLKYCTGGGCHTIYSLSDQTRDLYTISKFTIGYEFDGMIDISYKYFGLEPLMVHNMSHGEPDYNTYINIIYRFMKEKIAQIKKEK